MVYFTAPAQLQPCSVADRGSPATEGAPPVGRCKNGVFYSTWAAQAMLGSSPATEGAPPLGRGKNVYFTASARFQPWSAAFHCSPATEGASPCGRCKNGAFYSACAAPAMLGGIPRQSRHRECISIGERQEWCIRWLRQSRRRSLPKTVVMSWSHRDCQVAIIDALGRSLIMLP